MHYSTCSLNTDNQKITIRALPLVHDFSGIKYKLLTSSRTLDQRDFFFKLCTCFLWLFSSCLIIRTVSPVHSWQAVISLMSNSLYVNWAIAFYTNKFDKDQNNWIGSKIASEATRVIHGQTWKYLFQM